MSRALDKRGEGRGEGGRKRKGKERKKKINQGYLIENGRGTAYKVKSRNGRHILSCFYSRESWETERQRGEGEGEGERERERRESAATKLAARFRIHSRRRFFCTNEHAHRDAAHRIIASLRWTLQVMSCNMRPRWLIGRRRRGYRDWE